MPIHAIRNQWYQPHSALFTGGGGGGGGITFTATATASAAPGFATSGNFSMDIGTASSDRVVIVVIGNDGNATIGTVTVNGVTATLGVGNGTAGSTNNSGMWYANVPSGSGVQTVAWSGASLGVAGIACVVGYLTGQSGGGSVTPTNSGFYNTNQAQPQGPLAITVPSGGIAIDGIGASFSVSTTPTMTWTGTTSGSGDLAIGNLGGNGVQAAMAHSTSSGNVTASSSASMDYTGANLMYLSFAS